jgi:hypothetical protein
MEQNNIIEVQSINVDTTKAFIDTVNIGSTSQVLEKIRQFQDIVRTHLKEDVDYGFIPNTNSKKVLLKPGAEKILMLMGLTSEYEIMEKVEDFEKGIFAYRIKCSLFRNGNIITNSFGLCTNQERKYKRGGQDPFSLGNTVLKMAKKRALVDAVLTVASLSDIFTQDIDTVQDAVDLGIIKEPKEEPKISKEQQKELFKVAGFAEVAKEAIKRFGYEKSEDIKLKDFYNILKIAERLRTTKEVV